MLLVSRGGRNREGFTKACRGKTRLGLGTERPGMAGGCPRTEGFIRGSTGSLSGLSGGRRGQICAI